MKTVFSSNSQLAHVWANQSQESGRANNTYFSGCDIYSYGSHFLAARIYVVKGKRFALVRSDKYSNTTAKHLSEIRSALSGLMPYFESPDVTDLRCAVNFNDGLPVFEMGGALKRIKYTSKEDYKSQRERIAYLCKNADTLRALLGKSTSIQYVKPKQWAALLEHAEKRIARYAELNTPEAIAAREAKAQALAERKLALSIEKFRRGESVNTSLPFDLIRVQGDEVVTSRGARVPLTHAQRLLRMWQSGRAQEGERIGHFTVSYTDTDHIKIGCHKIQLSEAVNVLGGQQQ